MTKVRIITDALGGSPLSQLLQRGEAPAAWMPAAPVTPAAWRERAVARAGARQWDECWSLLEPALAATGAAAERLARVRREGGVVITTGQQPGLFGGPVYTWSKAMGALALADEIERETGIATVAVFWAATDDADFAEASFTILARSGGPELLQSDNEPPPGTPMALAPLGDITHLRARLHDSAGSAPDPRPLAIVDDAYADATRTVGDAYVAMLRAVLAPLGMPVLDASHDGVRRASDATLRLALRCAPQIQPALAERTAELRAAGLSPQVVDVAGMAPVFIRDGSIKRRLTTKEAQGVSGDRDAWLTPNVLLRPIVEYAILPTVAYVGGPGELAYFAQVSAVADAMSVERPLAVPRWSCTLVEPAVEKLLDRFAVEPGELADPGALEGRVARSVMSDASTVAISTLRSAIEGLPGALAAEAEPLGLGGAVEGSMQSLLHRMDRLERRLVAGIKRRESGLLRDVATLRAALRPMSKRQERALNLVPILSRHGLELLAEMRDAASGHARRLLGIGAS